MVVGSHPRQSLDRQAVRLTWGEAARSLNIPVTFVVGTLPDDAGLHALSAEHRMHGDLLLVPIAKTEAAETTTTTATTAADRERQRQRISMPLVVASGLAAFAARPRPCASASACSCCLSLSPMLMLGVTSPPRPALMPAQLLLLPRSSISAVPPMLPRAPALATATAA